MRYILLLLLIFVSCAKKDEELIDSAKQEAKYFLSSKKCSKARDVLTEVGTQSDDPVWISLHAATYACDAGYSELDTLFGGNLGNLSANSIINSLAQFSSSNETEADSAAYTNLKRAINILLNSDGESQPSAAKKLTKFGPDPGSDLNMQTLYLLLVQIGKFFAYYGNVDSNGDKGQGTNTNICLFSYTQVDLTTGSGGGGSGAAGFIADALAVQPNTCNTTARGHPDLEAPVEAATIKRRLCEGIVLYNNLLDILANNNLSSNDSLGELSNIATAIDTLLQAAATSETAYNTGTNGQNAIATLKDITGQDECEAVHLDKIQKYYAMFLEPQFN